jgi:glycosyltransferase involved in cell wall biosynthesis
MKNPIITICIPIKDGESYIAQAIQSCLKQSYKNYEILIIDNKSEDASTKIIKAFRSNKIRLLENKSNIGITNNFNACIKHAKGKYIKFLCADDILNPNCLEVMLSAFEKFPYASLVISDRKIIDSKGLLIGKIKFPSSQFEIDGYSIINKCLFGSNAIGEPSAVMFKKKDAVRGFSQKYKHLFDLEMWFHLLEKGNLINTQKMLCSVRRHKQQMTFTNIKSGALIIDNKYLFCDYIHKFYVKRNLGSLLKWAILYYYRLIRYSNFRSLLVFFGKDTKLKCTGGSK